MKEKFRLLHIVILFSSLILSACEREISGNEKENLYTGERLEMDMRLLSPKSPIDDGHIASVRVIIFNSNGKLVFNSVVEPETVSDSGITIKMEVARGTNNFYIICNENAELTTKLAALTREDNLEEITFQAAGITPPIPMYGKVIGGVVTADTDGSNAKVTVNGVTSSTLTVDVRRLMAKVNLTVIKNIKESLVDFTVESVRVRVCRMPKYTPLKELQPYTNAVWAENITFTGSGTLTNNGEYIKDNKVYSVPDGVDKITFPDIYIPEHLLSDPLNAEQATYLLLDASCRMKTGQVQLIHSIYIINLGENPPVNHHIKRNNHYNVYATIVGMGSMGIYAEILPMNMYELPINWKPLEGLVIVSDKIEDYDIPGDVSKNVNVWNDYHTYYGILKIYSSTGYKDIHFKYGSLLAIQNNQTAATEVPFAPPTSVNDLGDILWYPVTFGNPFAKISSWGDIPFSSDNIPLDNSRIAEGVGDPCKLVGLSQTQIRDEKIIDNKQWRMATPSDYNILLTAGDGESNATGFKAFHTHVLPNVKVRSNTGILSAGKNGEGHYWATEGRKSFGFTSNPISASIREEDPSKGFPVRCVRVNIPMSELATTNPGAIDYRGNIDGSGSPFTISSNLPYWSVKLIDDPSDPSIGNTTEFDDFSFTGGGTNVHSISGKNTQTIPLFIKRKESISGRTFNLRVTGIGYDGIQLTRIVSVFQKGYPLEGFLESFVPSLSKTNPSEFIPREGTTYTFSIRLTPNDVPIPTGKLQVVIKYQTTEIGRSNVIDTETYKYVYDGFSITVPENSTPDIIGISFTIYFDTFRSINDFVYYQKGK